MARIGARSPRGMRRTWSAVLALIGGIAIALAIGLATGHSLPSWIR